MLYLKPAILMLYFMSPGFSVVHINNHLFLVIYLVFSAVAIAGISYGALHGVALVVVCVILFFILILKPKSKKSKYSFQTVRQNIQIFFYCTTTVEFEK